MKEQLGELQDKFIVVTNESALREEQKQSAFASIERLQQQLDKLINEKNNPSQMERADNIVQTEVEEGPKVELVSRRDAEQQTDFTFGQTLVSQAAEDIKNGTEDENGINGSTPEIPKEKSIESNHESNGYSSSSSSSVSSNSLSPSPTAVIPRDEIIRQLETKLETMANEKREIQIANDKLQYFLTALESENESIGEYIALYRFQRQTIQKRVAEKDSLIAQLEYEKKAAQAQMVDLQKVLYNLFGQAPPVLKANSDEKPAESNGEPKKDNNNDLIVEKLNQIILEIQVWFLFFNCLIFSFQHRQHHSSVNTSSDEFMDPKLHCPECRGQMFTL